MPVSSANTLVFSVIETTLLRPVPYDAPDALVLINERSPVSEREQVAFEDYRDWRRDTTAFEALAAANNETFNLTGMGDPEQVSGSNVSAALFDCPKIIESLLLLGLALNTHSEQRLSRGIITGSNVRQRQSIDLFD